MPINVTCPSCHSRFKVSDQFAGKEGPCPKCKAKIKIPKLEEEVVVHAPQSFGPKDKTGEGTLKPIFRTETQVPAATWIICISALLVILGSGLWLRDPNDGQSIATLAIGAVCVAILISRLGYAFLRDEELEPFYGKMLWGRVLISAALYAGTWAGLTWLPIAVGLDSLAVYEMIILLGIAIGFGTGVAYLCFDLELGSAFFHYAFYLAATILLRLMMALPPFPVEFDM